MTTILKPEEYTNVQIELKKHPEFEQTTTKALFEEYKHLKIRTEQLKEHFEFEQSDEEKLERLNPKHEDMLKGLIVLCHAEIEDYLETIALNLLKKAEEKWNNEHIANYNLSSLFINSKWKDKDLKKLEDQKSNKSEAKNSKRATTSQTKSKHFIEDYKKVIESNHGLKEDNIKKLFNPLGYSTDDFNQAFISDLNSFGTERGDIAHKSANKVDQPLDKTDIIEKIDNIVKGIEEFKLALEAVHNANSE